MIVYENEELNKAYEIASMAHKNQKDKGGTEYINHPVAVSAHVWPGRAVPIFAKRG